MSKTLEDKQQFIELRAKGYSFAKIAKQINVSKPTLISWSQDEETFRSIANYRAINIDELQEKYAISKQYRIKAFGELLERVNTELAKRDLSQLTTGQLVNIILKLSESIKKDETEIEIIGEPEIRLMDIAESKSWKV